MPWRSQACFSACLASPWPVLEKQKNRDFTKQYSTVEYGGKEGANPCRTTLLALPTLLPTIMATRVWRAEAIVVTWLQDNTRCGEALCERSWAAAGQYWQVELSTTTQTCNITSPLVANHFLVPSSLSAASPSPSSPSAGLAAAGGRGWRRRPELAPG